MKVISIRAAADARGCEEGHAQFPRLDLPLARREFLKGSGVLVGTLAAGSVLAGLAPSTVWAVELKTLSQAEGATLMKMGRVLYPHDKLPDAVYALLAKDLDEKAAADAATAKTLREGIAALDAAAGGSFAKAGAAKRLAAVKGLESSPFFAAVRGQCITSLYNNDMAFAVFGYPGSSWEKGGYITRGFQDLKWLPAPPLAASPKPYLG
ncbi:MAG TPA: twin-arginine translocation signal domain-containing protein [Ideonella sp.]|nr:twin-arginine translocation signal domain-containing protein [Ideonella sp.]